MYLSLDRNLRAVLAVDYYAAHRMWPQALQAAQATPHNVYIVNTVNRALYHTGGLGRQLPLFQSAANLLLLDEDVRAYWNKIDLYLDLGQVNLALHHLTEALALYGERPYLLRRLALANLVLGNAATAKIYLRSLARTPFHSDWAKDYLRRLEIDPSLAQDAEVARLRGLTPARDELVPLPPEFMLSTLLDAHQDNRMAAEYLLCYYLLVKDLDGLTKNLYRLDSPDWNERPPLYDEAVLLAARRKPKEANLIARPHNARTQKRFERFAELAKACGRRPLSSSPQLVQEFGNTYFFYFFSQP
jgi:tetratricopeptide (TPR) repeat protein